MDYTYEEDGYYEWTNQVKCSCCGFNIESSLGNAKHLNLELEGYFDD